MALTATAIGSTLATVDRDQAGDWRQALAGLGRRLPVGWDAAGECSGGVAGYDLVLAVPRTLSALAWFLMSAGEDELADPILHAHHDALTAVAVEFGYGIIDPDRALGPEPRHVDLEQRHHHRAAHQVIERLHERQRTTREQQRDRNERAHADQARTRPSRADQPRSARTDERQRGGRERKAG